MCKKTFQRKCSELLQSTLHSEEQLRSCLLWLKGQESEQSLLLIPLSIVFSVDRATHSKIAAKQVYTEDCTKNRNASCYKVSSLTFSLWCTRFLILLSTLTTHLQFHSYTQNLAGISRISFFESSYQCGIHSIKFGLFLATKTCVEALNTLQRLYMDTNS